MFLNKKILSSLLYIKFWKFELLMSSISSTTKIKRSNRNRLSFTRRKQELDEASVSYVLFYQIILKYHMSNSA